MILYRTIYADCPWSYENKKTGGSGTSGAEAKYSTLSVSELSARRHSQKPDEMYELIEAVAPTPRIELFARTRRPGWDAWGNEVDSDIEMAF